MLKKLGIPTLALASLLTVVPARWGSVSASESAALSTRRPTRTTAIAILTMAVLRTDTRTRTLGFMADGVGATIITIIGANL